MQNARILKLARLLRNVALLGMIGLVAWFLIFLVFLITGSVVSSPDDPGQPIFSLNVFLEVLVYVTSVACSIYALEQLRRLFSCYGQGEIISDTTALHIRNAGAGLFWSAVLEIARAPFVWFVTRVVSDSVSYAQIGGGVGRAEIGFLFAAGVLTVIGLAMSEAARMAEENRAFV
ncbi:MAG: DUF2975 domain-containing protein [Paracoccaceae bacterium]